MTNTTTRIDIGRSVIVVPGLGGSNDGHWQSWFEWQISNTSRLAGVDWDRPELSLWLEQLLSALDLRPDGIVVAHSLGCALLAHAADLHPHLPVRGALLVAPADVDACPSLSPTLKSFADVPLTELAFPSLLIASTDDPYMSPQRARHFASAWGASLIDLGACGHINVASGFGSWPAGLQILRQFAGELESPANASRNSILIETERA